MTGTNLHDFLALRDDLGFSRPATSFARNFAMRSISFAGMGLSRGQRMVLFAISAHASSSLPNAAFKGLEQG